MQTIVQVFISQFNYKIFLPSDFWGNIEGKGRQKHIDSKFSAHLLFKLEINEKHVLEEITKKLRAATRYKTWFSDLVSSTIITP